MPDRDRDRDRDLARRSPCAQVVAELRRLAEAIESDEEQASI
jgi:hypothetical protein